MADPKVESQDTTHIYVARVWYKDTATLFNIASFVYLLLQETEFTKLIPERWHGLTSAFIIAFNLWIRFQSSTRPVALTAGTTVEVHSIEPKTIDKGAISDTHTARQILPVLLLLMLGWSCAMAGPRHIATVSVVSVHAVLSAVQDSERLMVCGTASAPAAPACVPAETHRKIAGDLVTAFDLDGQVAQTVRAVPTGALLPANVAELLGKIAGLVDRILAMLPSSTQKQALVSQIGGR